VTTDISGTTEIEGEGAVLLTGGAGYIGSHTALALLERGVPVVVVDDLSNSSPIALARVRELSGTDVPFHEVDVRDGAALDRVFAATPIRAVVHFAGLKAVGESVEQPLRYYDVNVRGTLELVAVMRRHGVRDLVFSSSATVYGDPERIPLDETSRLGATNPYGRTKLVVEQVLGDVAASEPGWRIALLRYFNPVGAHPSGRIGEDPAGIPNNLLPYVMQVAVGRREHVTVHGDDYPTPDGTGVRDYLHVDDLADGHVAALGALARIDGARAVNLGTGRGYSVLEVIAAARRASGQPIPAVIGPRRPGDIATSYADPSLAQELLGWKAQRDLDAMVADAWRWQSSNPQGYGG
jgi:UDP-glucose 4-epimerase